MKQILFNLFSIIAIVELLLMLLLDQVDIGSTFFWLPIFLDALLISITAILTVSFSIKKGLFSLAQQGQPEWIQIQIGLIVFFIEILIMQVFEYQPWFLEGWQEKLLDSFVLASLSALGIYFIVLRPAVEWQKKEDVSKVRFESTVIIILFSYLSVITVFLMFLILSYQQQLKGLDHELIEREVNSQKSVKSAFMQQLNQVISDVLSISKQVNVVQYLVDFSPDRKQDLTNDFLVQAVYKPEYDQLRLLNSAGLELIRIHRNEQGQAVVVEDNNLQNKRDRYYFKESLSLQKDQIYLSQMDLNIEHGDIQLPYKPVLRVASLVNPPHQKPGILVLNLNAQYLLDTLSHSYVKDNTSRQLIDENGFWLFGGSTESQWAFMFPEKQKISMQSEEPALWAEIQQNRQGIFDTEEGQVVYQSIVVSEIVKSSNLQYIPRSPQWYQVSFIPNKIISSELSNTRTMMIFAFIFISLLLAVGAYLLFRAIHQKKLAENKILQMIYSDSLTGLKNRKYFQWKLVREIYTASQQQSKLAILYIDLNKFKTINDEMGHEAGDLVLKKVANILLLCLRDDDTVARIGGDEFAAILPNVLSDQDLADICNRIISLITEGLDIGGMNFYLGINIGIATMNNYDEPIRSFIARADQAMYESIASDSVNYTFADKYRTV